MIKIDKSAKRGKKTLFWLSFFIPLCKPSLDLLFLTTQRSGLIDVYIRKSGSEPSLKF
jgi:hypothetical protein